MNLLRVWGGGIYEADEFYDVCDELGILVWQDFLFACAAYSEDDPLRSEIEAEAREAVTRLSSHPSLVRVERQQREHLGLRRLGVAGAAGGPVAGVTGTTPSCCRGSSPTWIRGRRTARAVPTPTSRTPTPTTLAAGTMHIWDVWNSRDYRHYRDYDARFVSEFGYQGPPAWSTLTSVVHDEPLDPYGPQMLVHQKALDGNLKLERGLGDHLPVWTGARATMIDDWHWITSLNQARAVAFGIEHFRSLYPQNRGTIVWQLNDNWPVVSWSAVDYAGIRKPLWFALRRVYADRLLTFQPRGRAARRP